MRILGIVLGFGGYMLVYASVAKSGKFATEPWAGLFTDAYTDQVPQSTSTTSTAPQQATSTPTVIQPRAITINA